MSQSAARFVRALDAACGVPAVVLTWLLWFAIAIGYLGPQFWLFDLPANFCVQYMVLFALCVVVLTIVRRRKTALVALCGVAWTTAMMAPFFQPSQTTDARGERLRLITFNVWYRNDSLERVLEFLSRSDADVLILQELDLARIDWIAQRLSAYPFFAMAGTNRHGVAMFSRWPLQASPAPLGTARILRGTLQWRGVPLTVFGAHLSWPLSRHSVDARTRELQWLADAVAFERTPVLVAGDFNLTPWSRHYERFVARSALADCAAGHGLLPTWPAQFALARIRIDMCFASTQWRVRNVSVGPPLGSDHLPVIVDVELATGDTPLPAMSMSREFQLRGSLSSRVMRLMM
jgi:endonuclease/exonuclease/phosphatase (EEP) superfamily protein YafD